MDNSVENIRKIPLEDAWSHACSRGWLSSQSPELQRALRFRARLRQISKGKVIYHMGDEAAELFCVIAGSVLVTIAHPILGAIPSHVILPGGWFGEVAALTRTQRVVTMECRQATLAIAITRKAVDDIIQASPMFAYGFFELFSLNQQIALRSAIDLLMPDPRARLCARLLTLCGMQGVNLPLPPISIPMTQEELAVTSCLSRKTVHMLLNEFVAQGICELHYRRITVLDVKALAGKLARH